MIQMENIVPLAALAVYKDAGGQYDPNILSTKTFHEILAQLRVHQDNMSVVWKPFNDKLTRSPGNSESRVHNVNESRDVTSDKGAAGKSYKDTFNKKK